MTKTISITPYGQHPAKQAGEFKVGDVIIMAHGKEFTITQIIAVTIASDMKQSFLEFSLVDRLQRISKMTKRASDLLGCIPKKGQEPKRKVIF